MRLMMWVLALLMSAPLLTSAVAARPAPMIATETASGGMAIGNPKAPIHLIEFMSVTCPHCAHFTNEGAVPLLRDYVARGKVYYEVRNALLNGVDMPASLLARCGGPGKFFGNMEALFASQKEWEDRLKAVDPTTYTSTDPQVSIQLIAEKSGMIALMEKRGFTAAQLNTCLADKGTQTKILAMSQDAWEVRHIKGTPTFYINNDMFDGNGDWPTIHLTLDSVLAVLLPKKR